jgi:tetratricopeptide (TPR) repeat protein
MTKVRELIAVEQGNSSTSAHSSYQYCSQDAKHALAPKSEPNVDSLENGEAVLAKLLTELAAQRFAQAATLLVSKIDQVLDSTTIVQLQELLSFVPPHIVEANADFCYSSGMIMFRIGQFQMALAQLQRARLLYSKAKQWERTVRCTIDIARLFAGQENFQQAFHYLAEDAQALLNKVHTIEPTTRAYYWVQMAHLATDTGQLRASTEYAKQALALYANAGDLQGQFQSQLRIARNFIQLGNYSEAGARLQLVSQYIHIGQLGAASEAQLFNAGIHLRWYQRQFDEAFRLAHLYLKLADHEQFPNARIYARLLLGNLHRDHEEYRLAMYWYNETQQLLTERNHQLYQPWVAAQMAWMFILQDETEEAQVHLAQSLRTTDWGQRMSFQVQQAVLLLMQERPAAAERLLQQSLTFYQQSGDPLACCAIQLYLAYAAMKQEDTGPLIQYLEQAFACLEEQALDVLPHWWHPQIMAEVCCQALAANVAPLAVQRIITTRLGRHSGYALARLLRSDDLDIRQQAQQLLSTVTGETMSVLSHLEDGPAKQILQRELESGRLQASNYPQLEVELITAKQRRQPNATLLAVFALHTRGVSRGQIAQQLECSIENVRNYITTIYRHFSLPATDFHSREARRQRLVKLARERNFIV